MAKVNFWYAGFIDPHTDTSSECPQAVYAGLKRLGYAINHVSPSGYRARDRMDCDLNVIYGMRRNGREIIENYKERGIPSIVVDLGYINRAMKSNGYQGYWQVSLDGLNWLPEDADSKRFDLLGIDYPKKKSRAGYVLIAEQTPWDASHGMDIPALNEWTANAVAKCEALGLDYKVRRHPMNKQIPKEELPDCPIEDDLEDAGCVYIHNSNVGNDALLAGIPVVCDEASRYLPTYHGIVDHELSEKPKFPVAKVMEDYLNRLAYAQWLTDEIVTGKAFNYVLNV